MVSTALQLPSFQVETVALQTKLPRQILSAKAFWMVQNEKILLYDTKYSVLFDPVLDSFHGGQFPIRFGAVGRSGQEIVLFKNRILCVVKKGTEVGLKSITAFGGGTIPALTRHLKTYRKEGAAVAAAYHGIYVCGGIDKLGRITGQCDYLHITGSGGIPGANHAEAVLGQMRPRSYATAVHIMGGELHVIGGTRSTTAHGRDACDIVDVLDRNSEWRRGPPLNIGRESSCAVVLLNRWIVVLGGTTGGVMVPEVEIMDTKAESPQWSVISKMERPRAKFSTVAVHTDIYVFGGGVADVDKISILVIPSASTTAPFSPHEDTRDDRVVPLSGNEDKKPAALAWPADVPTEEELLTLSADLLPTTPARPVIIQAFTLTERIEALQNWIVKMDEAQAIYVARAEKGTAQVTRVFNAARDAKLKQIELNSSAWLDDTQLQIDQARSEATRGKQLLEQIRASSLSNHLSRLDQDDFGDDVPSQLRCPITLNLMVNPVVASDGITYERAALEEWLEKEKTSPLTGAPLEFKYVFPNLLVKSLCEDFANQEPTRGRMNKCGTAM
mmetsp:Transcript_5474/g.9020  ORF Transcript_5474/g.9020 Transcript_5474/m.9020 type:complete len:558 (-) Transcript_5474:152-1825(-)|eukprot:CAMPEP_0119003502 /NCGR_PEP_ID=MMETSP1176-20130426/597_1 /TAXON_ID=265551 /ORGANISM="Synedropsis recta cf, Strain CCMP1620" /LENGTH=557 /DNA_ID=CAMNT_0006955113 /DNA_START=220 /DNA_END=1893 /DNA_ORIENTATION=-